MSLVFAALAASFHIAVFGDNQGDGPGTPEFDSFLCWVESTGPLAVIGTGDHVSTPGCSFIRFLEDSHSFSAMFWPAVADAENACWGSSQGDVGAGHPLLGYSAAGGVPSEGGSYSVALGLEGVDVRVISLHFPDRPPEPAEAFTTRARDLLESALEESPDSALVIAVAHSRYGRWDTSLDEAGAALLYERADLLLAGTIHLAMVFPGAVPTVNAGSLTRPAPLCSPAFLDLEVVSAESLSVRIMDPSFSPPVALREIRMGF